MIYAPHGASRECVRDPGSSELLYLKIFFENAQYVFWPICQEVEDDSH